MLFLENYDKEGKDEHATTSTKDLEGPEATLRSSMDTSLTAEVCDDFRIVLG